MRLQLESVCWRCRWPCPPRSSLARTFLCAQLHMLTFSKCALVCTCGAAHTLCARCCLSSTAASVDDVVACCRARNVLAGTRGSHLGEPELVCSCAYDAMRVVLSGCWCAAQKSTVSGPWQAPSEQSLIQPCCCMNFQWLCSRASTALHHEPHAPPHRAFGHKGAFIEHVTMLNKIEGVSAKAVRTEAELKGLDGE
jgi:hypothetical protein